MTREFEGRVHLEMSQAQYELLREAVVMEFCQPHFGPSAARGQIIQESMLEAIRPVEPVANNPAQIVCEIITTPKAKPEPLKKPAEIETAPEYIAETKTPSQMLVQSFEANARCKRCDRSFTDIPKGPRGYCKSCSEALRRQKLRAEQLAKRVAPPPTNGRPAARPAVIAVDHPKGFIPAGAVR